MSVNIKKTIAAVSAAAMLSSLTACGQNTTWAADIDGARIPAGMFIFYLQGAYYDAQTKIQEAASTEAATPENAAQTETEPDVFSSQVDGISAKEWIYNEATRQMQEYAAVEAKFEEYGLVITPEDEEAAELYCEQMWDYGGEFYTEMGVSKESYYAMYLNNEKRSMLFDSLYAEGGAYGVPDSEVKTYLDENYAMINYIEMELKDGEGNLLKSEGKAERMAMAESYVERYKNGEDLDALNAEYQAFYNNLIAEAKAKAEGAQTAEVTPSDAEAPLPGEGDTLLESEPSETAATVTEAVSEETTAAPAETEPAVSESAPVETAASETAPAVTEAPIETSEPIDSAAAVESNKTIIEKAGIEPDAAVAEKVFAEMNKGDIAIIESADSESYFIVAKLDVLENEDYFNSAKTSLLFEMKSEDYDALIAEWTAAQNVAKNQESYDRYDPEKIMDFE